MKGEHPHVRMVSEDVYLKVYYRNYDVDARFRFYNDGPAQTVRMGFPEWAHDYQRDKSAFQRFRTSVDGVSVPVKRVVERGTTSDYHAWWVKTVPFQAYQTRIVTVRFTAPVDTTPDGDNFHCVGYCFTGKAWKDKVAESRLTIDLPFSQAPLGGFARGSTGIDPQAKGFHFEGRRASYVRRNWEAEEQFELVYRDPPNFPRELREVSEADLKGKSGRQLTILRNEVVARRGRPFTDPALRKYFQSQSWYQVDPDYREGNLLPWEVKAMQVIQDYQSKHGLTW